MTIKEKLEKRVGLFNQMKALNDTISKEKPDLNTEEKARYSALEGELDTLSAQIDREERLKKAEDVLRGNRDSNYRPGVDLDAANKVKRKVDAPEYRNALNVYARQGLNGIMPEFRNALQIGTSSEGGYIVPTEFETQLVEILTNQDPIRQLAHKITTASDRNIPIETSKGTFAYIAEEGTYQKSDSAFGQVVLSAFKSGGIVQVAEELLQDAFFDLEAYLVRVAADRFNTLEETNFANGDGSSKPKGVFATASVGGVSVPSTTSSGATCDDV
jgi:HK97 family phage major capsid protein